MIIKSKDDRNKDLKFINKIIFKLLFCIIILLAVTNPIVASKNEGVKDGEEASVSQVLFEHVLDSYTWHFTDSFSLYLPIIVYTDGIGLSFFSSHQFFDEHHKPSKTYLGFSLYRDEGSYTYNIVHESKASVLDLSITKNVAMLFLVSLVLFFVVNSAASFYKKNPKKAPKGVAAFLEPIIIFLRDDVIKANIGHCYEKYLPYLVNLFFFILFGNLMGLLPGAANLTGNIAFTTVIALLTFIITNVSGNSHYWKHVFWTPGVPFVMKFIIVPVEILGLFTKPFSLLVRLFVAISAGHFVVLTFIVLGFKILLDSLTVEIMSVLVAVVINLIEILVALIQAYVFTMFSSLYIGMATEESH